jgi:glycosyltransferase involved in cell wall biosynthesis
MGHEIVLVCDPRLVAPKTFDTRNIAIVEYRSSRNPLMFASIAQTLHTLIGSQKANVIHCHSTYAGFYIRLGRFDDAKVLYTPHAWSFMKRDVSRLSAYVFAMFERRLARRCSRILCMSFEEVRAARQYGIAAEKIKLIYTGIPFDDAAVGTPVGIEASAHTRQPLQVGYFGRLDYQKGFDILLDALPLLEDRLHVHVFGTAVRGGLSIPNEMQRVTHDGWISPGSVRDAMQHMDVIVVPSRWEGLALVPIEAMRAGKMLVVAGESSLPEQVIHGYNGFILRQLTGTCLAEQLNALTIEDCRRMGTNSRHVFKNAFNAETFLTSLMNCYEDA